MFWCLLCRIACTLWQMNTTHSSTLQYTSYSIQYTLYRRHCTVYSRQYAIKFVQCTVHSTPQQCWDCGMSDCPNNSKLNEWRHSRQWTVCILQCTVVHCSVLYCTVVYCSVLHCSVLHCSVVKCSGNMCIAWFPLFCCFLCSYNDCYNKYKSYGHGGNEVTLLTWNT